MVDASSNAVDALLQQKVKQCWQPLAFFYHKAVILTTEVGNI